MAEQTPEHPIRSSFLYAHALVALRREPSWTVSMYATLNDLTDETTEELRAALRGELPDTQVEAHHG